MPIFKHIYDNSEPQPKLYFLGTAISTRLQIKQWLRENFLEVEECQPIKNDRFQQIQQEIAKDLRLVNLVHLEKCFRDLNSTRSEKAIMKGNSIIALVQR